jgi:type III restriction enzyme
MQLKDHLQRCLDKLGTFFRLTVQHGAPIAFMKETERPYREVTGLEGMPYVCLRVPTGGGKTFMAAHAVSVAARELLNTERVVCLWLVPSNVIREQTLAALKDRQHPYRQALDTAFGGNVVVKDLADALQLSYGDASGSTVILVSTLAALRVEETEGRKVYEPNGYLQPHFVGMDEVLRSKLEKEADGRTIFSLANVLRLHRPVVIMDEAHNARTTLSFDTLTRFNPSCVIELTATPEMKHNPAMQTFASNILHHVSARELKEAEMIKLPVKLRTRPEWKQVLGDAIAKRKELEALADANEKATGEYLRPIMLIQAQPQNKNKPTLTVELVKQALMTEFQIPEEQIAIATGQTRELDDVDLFGRNPIRFIITVQALKEGWDCSFAYVLCSLAEQHSARSIEQMLGRVLRMPRAKKKNHPNLNVAYAYAAAASWFKTAEALHDAMIESGFHQLEAKDCVVGPGAE